RRRVRSHGKDLVPDLDLHVRVRDEVSVPAGILRRAALRRDHDEVAPVAAVDERELPGLAGVPALRVENEAVRAVPVVTDLAARRFVRPDGLGPKEDVVRHAATVARGRRRSAPPVDRRRQTVGAVPPSIMYSLPRIEEARSEARKATSSATSSGRPGP